MSTGRDNEYPIAQPQQMALLALIHWGTGLLGKNALFIMLAQPHYVYWYEEPHIKISVCANDRTIPSGLLCSLNRPIFQLWNDNQSVFYNLIFFCYVDSTEGFFFFSLLKLDPSTWDGYWIYRGKKRHFKFLLISNNWNIFNIFIRIKSFICKTSPPWAHLINLILSSIDQGIIDLKYFSLKRI